MTLQPPLHADIAALLPRLRRFARSLAWHRDDADDLVQLAVERAMNRSAQWDRGTRLDSALLRLAGNVWAGEARFRGRRKQPWVPDEAGAHGRDDGSETQPRLAIQKAVSLLAEEHRLVVALVLVDGLPYREAAAVLEIPVGSLTSRLARAREALQGVLSDQARNMA